MTNGAQKPWWDQSPFPVLVWVGFAIGVLALVLVFIICLNIGPSF
jgi:hypothetical protein